MQVNGINNCFFPISVFDFQLTLMDHIRAISLCLIFLYLLKFFFFYFNNINVLKYRKLFQTRGREYLSVERIKLLYTSILYSSLSFFCLNCIFHAIDYA